MSLRKCTCLCCRKKDAINLSFDQIYQVEIARLKQELEEVKTLDKMEQMANLNAGKEIVKLKSKLDKAKKSFEAITEGPHPMSREEFINIAHDALWELENE